MSLPADGSEVESNSNHNLLLNNIQKVEGKYLRYKIFAVDVKYRYSWLILEEFEIIKHPNCRIFFSDFSITHLVQFFIARLWINFFS